MTVVVTPQQFTFVAYDAALIRLARRRGIATDPADFELPERGRAALEDALISKGVNLPRRTPSRETSADRE